MGANYRKGNTYTWLPNHFAICPGLPPMLPC